MEEWKEYKLGDVCNTISDTYRGNAKNVVLINTSDVLEGKCLNHEKTPNKNLKGQFKKTFRKGDILYSEIRPANRRYAYIDFEPTDYIASTKLMVIRHNESILPQYLFYILKSQAVLEELQMLAESRSGTFPQITFSEVANMVIKLPPIDQQRQILGVLKSLDDKIEVNRRINENLEQQAQALFKSWFVDFEPFRDGEFQESELGMIPKGWRVYSFKDVCINISDGVHNTVKDDLNGNYFLLSCKNIKGGHVSIGGNERRINQTTFEKLRKRTKIQKGDILLSSVGTIGEIVLLNEEPTNYEFQRSVAIIKPNSDIISSHFLFYSMKNQKDTIIHSAHGAVQQCLFISDVAKFITIYPPQDIMRRFTDVAIEIHNIISKKEQESRRLAELRDTLLPRLMSGELKVSDVTL